MNSLFLFVLVFPDQYCLRKLRLEYTSRSNLKNFGLIFMKKCHQSLSVFRFNNSFNESILNDVRFNSSYWIWLLIENLGIISTYQGHIWQNWSFVLEIFTAVSLGCKHPKTENIWFNQWACFANIDFNLWRHLYWITTYVLNRSLKKCLLYIMNILNSLILNRVFQGSKFFLLQSRNFLQFLHQVVQKTCTNQVGKKAIIWSNNLKYTIGSPLSRPT